MILKSFYKHFSALFFDTSFLHYFSTIIFYSIRHQLLCRIISKKAVDSTAFFVILRQISTAFDIQCEKCCRIPLNDVENCCRKLLSYFNVEIYCRKRLSNHNSTIFFDIFLHKKSCGAKNVVVLCRNLLSKKLLSKIVVEKC